METNNTVFLGNKRSCFSVLLGNEQSCFSVPAGLPCKKQNCCFVLNLDLDASMPHSLQCIVDGRIGWWAHTKQHSCGSLHTLCLYFKERNECPLVRWLQITGCTSNSQNSLGFNGISRRDKETAACIQGNKALLIGIWLYILPSV